ncbi:MAG: hypothetical protein ACLR7U_08175 [Ruthenibacterium lactatiformans]
MKITGIPVFLQTLSQLQICTGVYEADAALHALVDYFRMWTSPSS